MGLICLQPPLIEPVSLPELKEFLRVSPADTSQDDTILNLALDARSWCEEFTKRRFVQQTWRLLMDFFPGYIDLKLAGQKVSSPFVSGSNAVLVGIRYAIVLPYPPVQSIVQFAYLNANGSTTVLNPASEYVQDLSSNPARLTPPFGSMWPVARVVPNAVNVDFIVGYASPVTLSTTSASATVTASGYTFTSADVNRDISIPGAGANGTALNTIVLSIAGSSATLRDKAGASVSGVTSILVNTPSAKPGHWAKIRRAIKVHTNNGYWKRLPQQEIENSLERMLGPVRDIRL